MLDCHKPIHTQSFYVRNNAVEVWTGICELFNRHPGGRFSLTLSYGINQCLRHGGWHAVFVINEATCISAVCWSTQTEAMTFEQEVKGLVTVAVNQSLGVDPSTSIDSN